MSRLPIVAGVVLALLLALLSTTLVAQPAGQNQPPLRYRRIFVPQDELQSQVKGLLPLKREEFERRAMAGSQSGAPADTGIRIARAEYSARFAGQYLIDGQARWEIVASAESEGKLILDPCNLALGPATWDDDPLRRAAIAIGSRNAMFLEVKQSGVVSLPWSRRGQELDGGGVEFDLTVPAASLTQLRLRLPSQLQVSAEPGLVASSKNMPTDGEAEWLVELGGMRQVKLRITPAGAQAAAGNLVLLKEQARYTLLPTDVTADFQLQVDVHGQMLRSARLQIDPRLQVTGVTVRNQAAAWSLSGDEPNRALSIEFPEPLTIGSHTVLVQGTAPMSLTQPLRLPRIRWEGTVWQEGSVALTVPATMRVAVTQTSACRPTQVVPPGEGSEGLGFQYHASDGFIEIEAFSRRPRLAAATGMTVQLDASQIVATLRADLTIHEGDAFETIATISNDWILDSLETEPADMLEDRPIVTQDERTRTMRLKFLRPITPRSPVRLVVRARRQQSGVDLPSQALMRWFQLPEASERSAVLAIRSNIPNVAVQIAGDLDASRLNAESATADELSLLDAPLAGWLLRLPPAASDFQVQLREGDPRYAASWELTVACSRNRLRQEAAVRCLPAGPGISRLKITSIPPPQREIRWHLVGAGDATVVAQTRSDTGIADSPTAEATWEVEFSRPLSQPFSLESNWETPRVPRQLLPLFACMEATSQTCQVQVIAEDDAPWLLETGGLTAVPTTTDPDRFTRTRGLFRYLPGQRPHLSVLDASQETLVSLAQVERAELTTRFSADGSLLGTLTLTVVNAGLNDLPLSLPSAIVLQEVVVDGQQVEPLLTGQQPGSLRIPLPNGARLVEVNVSFAAGAQARGLWMSTWRVPLPEVSLPHPPLTWQVALPPGFRQVADEGPAGSLGQDWQARLGGPLIELRSWAQWLRPWQRAQQQASQSAVDLPRPEPTVEAGWLRLTTTRPWSSALSLEVCQPRRLAVLGLALALGTASLVLMLPRRLFTSWYVLIVVLAALVLVVPPATAPLAAGAFWGVVLGCVVGMLRPASTRAPSRQSSRVGTTRTLAGAAPLALLLVAGWLRGPVPLSAAPPADPLKDGAQPAAYRVVIPVDDNQQPTGDYVFVDEGLYEWLFARSQPGNSGEQWQLTNAVYDVRWPNAVGAGVPAADLRINLEVETFAADVPVMLPFRRQELLLKQGGTLIDGMTLAVNWQEDGRGLTAVIPVAGRYRIELAGSVPLKESEQQQELQLAIPRAPHAVARFSNVPGNAATLSTSALGSLKVDADAPDSASQFDLGPASELSLRLPSPQADASDQVVEVEHYEWWKVRPGSVVVDAVCKFRALAGTVRELQIRFDPRLRLLPLEGLPAGSRQWAEAGMSPVLHIALAEPASELVVRPRFLLADASGIGQLVLPRLTPAARRISRHWMAVSTGPGLEVGAASVSLPAIPPADFAQAHSSIEELPAVAFDLAGRETLPEFEFRPESRQAAATSETTVHCGLAVCRLRFHAELSGLTPQDLQHRVVLPPGWTATQVVVRDGDLPLANRWFQQSDGTVVVRLPQPLGSTQQLQVEAMIRPAPGAALVLPAVNLLQVSDAGQALRVVRSYDCDVQLSEIVGWVQDQTEQVDQHVPPLGRLVASLRGASGGDREQLTLRITPNRPQVLSRMVTRFVRQSAQSTEAVVVCDFDIASGQLDALRLEVPPEWSGPWQTSPSMAVQSAVVPGQARGHVTLIPTVPLSGRSQLTLTAPLRPSAGDPLRVPDVTLVDLPQVQRWVQFPLAGDGDAPRWTISGLQSAPLPPDLRTGILAESGYETLAVVSPGFEAALSTAEGASRPATVSLAEYHAAWREPGVVQGQATFHFDPGGLDSCAIDLPAGCQPALALLDGMPASMAKEREGRWRVALPGERLPLHLVIHFFSTVTPADGRLLFAAPEISGLPAQATIWTLDLPNSLTVHSTLREAGELLHLDQDLLRLASVAEMIDRAAQREATGISTAGYAAWSTPWRTDASLAIRRAEGTLRTLVGDSGDRPQTLQQLQSALQASWKKLPGGQTIAADSAASEPQRQPPPGRLGTALSTHQPQLELTLERPALTLHQWRLGSMLAMLVVVAALWLLCRWSPAYDWLAASGSFPLALLALALTLFSPLGWSALALALAALLMSWHLPWRPIPREHRSSILRPSA